MEYQTWKAARDAPYFKRMPSELTEMRNLGGEGGDEDEREDAAEASEDEEGPGLGRKQRYEPALRWTSADETGDVHSLERALDQRLFMLVRAAGARILMST